LDRVAPYQLKSQAKKTGEREMKELVRLLEMEISRINQEQEDYYADGNSADYYSQSLHGKIKGLELAIQIVKKN
jgi:hypothetical protein